ncbi:hypothetical protein [Salidesulfovibrio onnuriiensis]|uniref:hypothetical protein n=1 Tax=Salidesulfovibrio onnuriiensis TaxID=2583823 RepID=UPI0011CAA296|nr:hypothetical protein [Salidesulfovibrio onnuriiensis]
MSGFLTGSSRQDRARQIGSFESLSFDMPDFVLLLCGKIPLLSILENGHFVELLLFLIGFLFVGHESSSPGKGFSHHQATESA